MTKIHTKKKCAQNNNNVESKSLSIDIFILPNKIFIYSLNSYR